PLADVPLELLDAAQTPVADLSPLAGNTTLRQIDVGETAVATLDPLSATGVAYVDASHAPIRSLAGLHDVPNLRVLDLDGDPLGELDPLLALAPAELLITGNPLDAKAAVVIDGLCTAGWAVRWDEGTCGNPCSFESCTD